MSEVTYKKSSPYYTSEVYGFFLDVMQHRDIPGEPDDVVYRIDNIYSLRPDLLANDLYGDSSLWWVFANRNPNTLIDPLFDFVAGKVIYIPKKENVLTALGL